MPNPQTLAWQTELASCEAGGPGGLRADLAQHLVAEGVRGKHAGRVAGVDPRFFDVLHDAGDPHHLPVAERVDVNLDRVLEEAVEVDLGSGGGADPLEILAQT